MARARGSFARSNRRSTVGLQFTRRWARTTYVPPSPGELELYTDVAGFVREHLHQHGGGAGSDRRQPVEVAGDKTKPPNALNALVTWNHENSFREPINGRLIYATRKQREIHFKTKAQSREN